MVNCEVLGKRKRRAPLKKAKEGKNEKKTHLGTAIHGECQKIGIWFEREIETGAETTRQTFLGNTADIAGLSREWFTDSCADASLLPFFASTMVC